MLEHTVAPAVRATSRAVRERLPTPGRGEHHTPAFGVERLAEMRAKNPRPMNRLLESTMSALAMPATVLSGSLERLLSSMDRYGVERAVLIGAPPIASNDWLLDEVMHEHGDRLMPFVTLPPLDQAAGEEVWAKELAALAGRGACGFKIHPNMDGLSPDHAAYRALFSVAEERDLPVILHTGCFDVAFYARRGPADPTAFEPLFSRHPSVRVCLAHMNRETPERAWEVMKRHDQLYTDTSWQTEDSVRRAIAAIGASRILLGSDWPLLHPELEGEAIDILRRAANDEEVEQIGLDNALAFLGDHA